MRYRRSLVALLAVALSACAGQAPAPIPGAESVTAEAPTYKVGDEWRFATTGYSSRVWIAEVTGDKTVSHRERPARLETCPGCRYVRDRNLVLLEVLDPNGQRRADGHSFGVGVRSLDFPMRVGSAWTSDTPPFRDVFKVEAYEMVNVPAGMFKAFRIRQDRENTASGWRGTSVSWWAPEVRWFVRLGKFRDDPGGDFQLESYNVK